MNGLFRIFVCLMAIDFACFQLKASLSPPKYTLLMTTLTAYQRDSDFNQLISAFFDIFQDPHFHYLFKGMLTTARLFAAF